MGRFFAKSQIAINPERSALRAFFAAASLAIAAAGALAALCGEAAAQTNDFYKSKTINFIIGYGPGGGVDSASRVILRHLPRFIPGKPDIVGQNMEGAGGIIAANFMGAKAPRDGLTIGLLGRSWFVEGIVRTQGANFDPAKFSYIGSTGTNNTLLYVRASLGVASLEELKAYGAKHPGETIPAAGIGPGTSTVTVPNLLAGLGYPLRPVLGYNSSARVLVAIEQGEIGAYFTPEDSFAQRPDLLTRKIIAPVLQSRPGIEGVAVLKDIVPQKDQAVLSLFTAYDDVGLMVVAPPDAPQDRLEILRKAYTEMCADADFQADARKIGEPVGAPIPGERLSREIERLSALATPSVISEYRRIGAGK